MKKRVVAAILSALFALALFTGCEIATIGTKKIVIEKGTDLSAPGSEDGVYAYEDIAQKVASEAMLSTLEITAIYQNTSGKTTSMGTGYFVTEDGYVVTNHHVVHATVATGGFWGGEEEKLCNTIYGEFYNSNEQISLDFVASDATLDIAILKVKTKVEGIVPLVFADSDELVYGQPAVAIGNAEGFGLSVTFGVISNPYIRFKDTSAAEGYIEAVQTDAAINPGNSGGPLLDKYARLVGMNTFKLNKEASENMAYAVPSNVVAEYFQKKTGVAVTAA